VSEKVIVTTGLTVYYGTHRGIHDVDLEVEKGEVFGFLGPNGAGKTTTQRVLLDVIRPTRGRATVFGMDTRSESKQVRKYVSYLPGELSLYTGLTGRQFLSLMASLEDRPIYDSYRDNLCDRLDLDPSRKIKEYSRGNKQKIGVVAAFMSKAQLVILDEPTIGLDPLIQQVVMELVREARTDGRTVFFSSHILQEVQAVCDRVGIIRDGRLIKTETVEALTRQQFKRVRLVLKSTPPPEAFHLDGVREAARDGNTVVLEISSELEPVLQKAMSFGIEDLATQPVTLEEAFLAFYGRGQNGGNNG
jgi:ABC-2 type transport system ATP-binding protein